MLKNLFLAVCIIACGVWAQTWNIGALNATDVTATLDSEGTMTISGSGAMANWGNNVPWQNVIGNIKAVIIEYGVTNIGDLAFWRATGLTSATIPNSVTTIGGGAFWGASRLTEITIPNSVTTIGEEAFSGATGLTSVTIGNSVTIIGNGAFRNTRGLTEVIIPNSVTTIGDGAFRNATGLTEITIPNSVTAIGASAFSGATGLTSVIIGNSVTIIDEWAFENARGLTSVTIPNSVRTISVGAFCGATGLTEIISLSTTPPATHTGAFGTGSSRVNTSIPVYVPVNSVDAYKATSGWRNFTNIIGIEDETSIVNRKICDNRHGIRFAQNIVSDKAEISVILPNNERAIETKIVIHDMTGNVVHSGASTGSATGLSWDLRNTAGRFVANGTYLVIAEVKSASGKTHAYSARLGVKR